MKSVEKTLSIFRGLSEPNRNGSNTLSYLLLLYLYMHGIFAVALASFHIQDPSSSDWVLFLTSAIAVSTQIMFADYLVRK